MKILSFSLVLGLSFLSFAKAQIIELKTNDTVLKPIKKLNSKTPFDAKDQTAQPSHFYKNIDSAKASRYKILNKKPNEIINYSTLKRTKEPIKAEIKNTVKKK